MNPVRLPALLCGVGACIALGVSLLDGHALPLLGAAGLGLVTCAAIGPRKALIALPISLTVVAASRIGPADVLAGMKLLTLGAGALLLLVVGMRANSGLAWISVALTSALFIDIAVLSGGAPHQIETAELVRAFLGYIYAWSLASLSLSPEDGRFALRLIAWAASASVVVGVCLAPLTAISAVRVDAGTPRLQGALIPAHLALLAFVGLAAGLWLMAVVRRGGRLAVASNLLIIVGTGTRGAAIAAVVTLGLSVWFGRGRLSPRQKRLAILSGIAAVVLFVPILIQRSSAQDYAGTVGFNASGRSSAWPFFVSQFLDSPAIGKGLGFSSVAVERLDPEGVQAAFQAPHNTYLQLLVDGGVAFGALVAIAIGLTIARVWRTIEASGRRTLSAVLVGSALYAIVDNLLSTPQFIVPFALLLSAVAATGSDSGRSDEGVEAPIVEPQFAIGRAAE